MELTGQPIGVWIERVMVWTDKRRDAGESPQTAQEWLGRPEYWWPEPPGLLSRPGLILEGTCPGCLGELAAWAGWAGADRTGDRWGYCRVCHWLLRMESQEIPGVVDVRLELDPGRDVNRRLDVPAEIDGG